MTIAKPNNVMDVRKNNFRGIVNSIKHGKDFPLLTNSIAWSFYNNHFSDCKKQKGRHIYVHELI